MVLDRLKIYVLTMILYFASCHKIPILGITKYGNFSMNSPIVLVMHDKCDISPFWSLA